MIAWTVDDAAPTAQMLPLGRLTRHVSQPLRYRGADQGGSGLSRYEIRTRRANPRGAFTTDPVTIDETGESIREGIVHVGPGQTACVSVRSVDRVGNASPWTDGTCTTREIEETALRSEGNWKKVQGESFSDGHALKVTHSGPALSYVLDRSSKVSISAGSCRECGRLAVEVNGHRRRVIDLGRTRRDRLKVADFDSRWTPGQEGHLRLVALGGGPVVVDSVTALRSNGF